MGRTYQERKRLIHTSGKKGRCRETQQPGVYTAPVVATAPTPLPKPNRPLVYTYLSVPSSHDQLSVPSSHAQLTTCHTSCISTTIIVLVSTFGSPSDQPPVDSTVSTAKWNRVLELWRYVLDLSGATFSGSTT